MSHSICLSLTLQVQIQLGLGNQHAGSGNLDLFKQVPDVVCLWSLQIVFQPNKNEAEAQLRAQLTARDDPSAPVPVEKPQIAKKPLHFLWVDRLREYLAFEFKPERNTPNFEYDAERAYDDFGEFQLPQCHQA